MSKIVLILSILIGYYVGMELVFIATTKSSLLLDILLHGRPQNVLCELDEGACLIDQDKKDDFDWIKTKGPTPSNGTGPPRDHFTSYSNGKYIYAEASFPRKHGDRARLTVRLWAQYPSCLYFYYHMHGLSMGTLKVYVDRKLAWRFSGNQGDQWLKGTIPVLKDGFHTVDIDAIIGSSFTTVVSVDDLGYQELLKVSKDNCMVSPSNVDTNRHIYKTRGTLIYLHKLKISELIRRK